MLRHLVFLFSFFLCLCVAEGIGRRAQGTRAFAEEGVEQKQPGQGSLPPQKIASPQASAVKGKKTVVSTRQREPFRIAPEFEAQREEVEPPEIKVKGIMQAKGKTVALAELQLEKVEGTVMLEPGMRVSIPKPDREQSESEKWMTYFTVRTITRTGMVIVLENGEVVWYPVMGGLD